MSELPGKRRAVARARLLVERRELLRLVGAASLTIGVASGVATLASGSSGGPSPSFVVQCLALGGAAWGAARLQRLRKLTPQLSLGATLALLAAVALEVLRSGEEVATIAAASTVALLPILAVQVTGVLRRALVMLAVAAVVLLAARGGGLGATQLVPFGAALALGLGIALVIAQRLEHVRLSAPREASRDWTPTSSIIEEGDEAIANLSHDLRNPLAIAVGFAEMAADADLSADERAEALDGLRRSLWDITQLVENVLDGSADQAGALHPTCERVPLEPLCREALAAMRVLLRGRPIVLVESVEPGLAVLADRHRLGRVLANLLGNAAKYTERGEIALHAARRGDTVVIRVSDTGPGIPPEAVPFIFDRFRRAHDGGRGAGLGLAIARRLTERMGGSLEVESTLGVGSTFSIVLPRALDYPRSKLTHAA